MPILYKNTLHNISLATLTGALCFMGSSFTHALSADEIEIHGFFTAGATISDVDKTYLRTTDDDLSFDEDSALGLQIIVPIDEQITLQAQLLANGSKEAETNFEIEVDWAFVSYQVSDDLTLRAGRIRFPILMLGDYAEVGYAYPWIRPPQEVYGGIPITAIDGVDLLYTLPVGNFNLTFQPFVGQRDDQLYIQPLDTEIDTELDNMLGLKVSLSNDYLTLHAAYNTFDTSLDEATPTGFVVSSVPPFFSLPQDAETTLLAAGANLEWRDLVVMTEYLHADYEREDEQMKLTNYTAWYTMVGYRFGKLMPHVTFSDLDSEDITRGQSSETLTVGLRYELSDSSALKLEWSRVEPQEGTSGLLSADASKAIPTPYGVFDVPLGSDGEDASIFSVAFEVIF